MSDPATPVGRRAASRSQEEEPLERRTELRLRTAMELHDGILQTLTAAGMRIAAARQLLRDDPTAAEEVLDDVVESIVAEQREIRLYVDEIRDGSSPSSGVGEGLADRLATLVQRVGQVWGARTSVECRVTDGIPPELDRQILRIAQEATVNAIRHGGADEVAVMVGAEGSEVVIEVTDDGHGFPFLGEYDHETLKEERLGPVSLKQRVQGADGRVAIRSTRTGARVTVRLPLNGREAG